MKTEFYSCGKLLITGEYLILRGARGLALPTSRGQRLEINPFSMDNLIMWRAQASEGIEWFNSAFTIPEIKRGASTDDLKSKVLEEILFCAQLRNPEFLNRSEGVLADTTLEFPRDWGLGSSSTLVHLIAQWAQVDAFDLQEETLGGSGYDVMVSEYGRPIVFARDNDRPVVDEVSFVPSFKDKLWFVYCGHKQDSTKEVMRFNELSVSALDIDHISRITDEVVQVQEVTAFERLLWEHDFLLSRILGMPSASEVYPDFKGLVKYLGAWGGDFMLAVGEDPDMDFFRKRGMNTILSYQDMIKQ